MTLLLDTHVFLWSQLAVERLAPPVIEAIRDPRNQVALSAVCALEMAIKQSLGKLGLPGPAARWVPEACERSGIDLLALDADTALAVGELPWVHRDPFDRLLVAQASRGFTLVTHDRVFASYPVSVLWA
jgi:PIN domain nuclease of toxin-antitoxin system